MSISLTNFLGRMNNLVDDSLSGTTDSAGNAAKTTFIDSALSKYDDAYFGDPERNPQWWAYISSQLRSIKQFTSSSGTGEVHKAFSAQIASSTAYELHRFDRDQKIIACNQALYDAYPYFYLRVEDLTTLDGKGPSNTEYEVPSTFTDFPDQIFEEYESSNIKSYIPIVHYQVTDISGTKKFYANITKDRDILLIGKKYLSQFTNDASTTELSAGQANTIVLLAASIFYRMLSGTVNAADSERYDSLANRYEARWDERKFRDGMALIAQRDIDFAWSRSGRRIGWIAPGW